ncbi:hypothetical protein [Streptomyces sp. NPDC057877]|uniref:hypothetical protein n=1 Tax=Streptomyces sp. NPDC057877 TaxID=3346269 RepID=UPI003688B343
MSDADTRVSSPALIRLDRAFLADLHVDWLVDAGAVRLAVDQEGVAHAFAASDSTWPDVQLTAFPTISEVWLRLLETRRDS